MHRKWIVDEATRQLHQPAQPSQKLLTPADPSEPPQEYTTIAREMAEIGAPRLNILKVRPRPLGAHSRKPIAAVSVRRLSVPTVLYYGVT